MHGGRAPRVSRIIRKTYCFRERLFVICFPTNANFYLAYTRWADDTPPKTYFNEAPRGCEFFVSCGVSVCFSISRQLHHSVRIPPTSLITGLKFNCVSRRGFLPRQAHFRTFSSSLRPFEFTNPWKRRIVTYERARTSVKFPLKATRIAYTAPKAFFIHHITQGVHNFETILDEELAKTRITLRNTCTSSPCTPTH